MSKLLINGVSAKSGGGQTILKNLLSSIPLAEREHIEVIFPNNYPFDKYEYSIFKIPPFYNNKLLIFFYFFFIFPKYFKKRNYSGLLNLADFVVPRITNQTYFFDWAYLIVDDKLLWNNIGFLPKILRKIKSKIISSHMKYVQKVIVQTEHMQNLFIKKFPYLKNKITILPTPVTVNYDHAQNSPITKNDLIYVTNYAPHKNLFFVLDVARILKENNSIHRIFLTINEKDKFWPVFDSLITEYKLNKYVVNLGQLEHNLICNNIKSSGGLFYPSLLESYGMPLIEAQVLGVDILAADIPYTKDVRGDSAVIFSPYDSNDAYDKICLFFQQNRNLKPLNSNVSVDNLIDWKAFSVNLLEISA